MIDEREIMADDFNYKIGNSEGYFYAAEDAKRACQAVGWELISNHDFLSILKRYADDENASKGFDPIRGYGALIRNGDSGFDANLRGL